MTMIRTPAHDIPLHARFVQNIHLQDAFYEGSVIEMDNDRVEVDFGNVIAEYPRNSIYEVEAVDGFVHTYYGSTVLGKVLKEFA